MVSNVAFAAECGPTSCSDTSGTMWARVVTGLRSMCSLACSSFGLMSASICRGKLVLRDTPPTFQRGSRLAV